LRRWHSIDQGLRERDTGQHVQLALQDELTLLLRENPTTGYRWSFEQLEAAVLTLREDLFVGLSGKVGAGGERRFSLTATGPGTTELRLKLARGSGPPESVQRHFCVTVSVSP
jgi:inhibitor of cysteine peptidase